jgi:L-ascorbate metabolism protein UlaG (beta-lactamase superfamily)
MELTKHTHATVVLSKDGSALLIDPGAYTPNTAELLAAADAVLFTHDHPDHVDADALRTALADRPGLPVFGPAGVREFVGDDLVEVVAAGDTFTTAGFEITVFGGEHAIIHADLPPMQNVAFLIDGDVFHPGDAYEVPTVPVKTLLVPTSGPWSKVGEGVDFVRAVKPERAIQIHDLMLSEAGRQSTAQFIGDLAGTPLETLPLGATVTL